MSRRNVADAIMLARVHHWGQVDKSGADYIQHPMAVMESFGVNASPTIKIVAVLHDIVEDTKMTLQGLRERGYSDEIVDAIDAISRREGERYSEYVERLAKNPLSVTVKIADLKHNMSPERMAGMRGTLRARYERTLERLVAP